MGGKPRSTPWADAAAKDPVFGDLVHLCEVGIEHIGIADVPHLRGLLVDSSSDVEPLVQIRHCVRVAAGLETTPEVPRTKLPKRKEQDPYFKAILLGLGDAERSIPVGRGEIAVCTPAADDYDARVQHLTDLGYGARGTIQHPPGPHQRTGGPKWRFVCGLAAELAARGRFRGTADDVAGLTVPRALAALHGLEPDHLSGLAHLVSVAARDMTEVTLRLDDSTSPEGKYQLTIETRFPATSPEILIALTIETAATEALAALAPIAIETFTCANSTQRESMLRELTDARDSSIAANYRYKGAGHGQWRETRLPLSPIADAQHPALADIPAQVLDGAVFLRADAGDASVMRSTDPGQFRLVFRAHDMELSEEFAFWSADRPMYLTRLVVDAVHFSPEARIRTRLGDANAGAPEGKRLFETDIDGWVVRGHGVDITWSWSKEDPPQ